MPRRRPALRVEHHPRGKRVWVFDRRIHHAHVGLILIAAGAWAVIIDWADYPWPFRDST